MDRKRLAALVAEGIDSGMVSTRDGINRLKARLGKKSLRELPSNPDLLALVEKPSVKARQLLGAKPTRTISGVAAVAIMTRPKDCEHGTCIFCPGGENSFFGSVPKSYTGNEPATMRAIANHFDPYLQVKSRLLQYVLTGHSPQKIELIVMGGTFPSFGWEYQKEFVAGAFRAMNDFSGEFFSHGKLEFEKAVQAQGKKIVAPENSGPGIEAEKEENEQANVKCVALCIETKPDWCMEPHIDRMLELGTTRVELGIQGLDDKVLKFANRGHTARESVEATRLLKDSGLKVTYHMMPGLPLSSRENDLADFRELFENPDFRPDALKIYPCMVMPGTPLERLWREGKFTPLSNEDAAEIIAEGKRFVPKWCRIQRIQRDIPSKLAVAGKFDNNLRQVVEKKTREKGIECQCIRCREIGLKARDGKIDEEKLRPEIVVDEYGASGGVEFFISFEDKKQNALLGFCRLRLPFQPFRKELRGETAVVRELHVFGKAAALGETNEGGVQHHGIGKTLLAKAEEIAFKEYCKKRLCVISGIGAREYYYRLGYEKLGAFVVKDSAYRARIHDKSDSTEFSR